MGLITRTTRSNLLDVMSTDYIRTARAKGLSRVGLIVRHALGNALIPVLTVIGLGLGNLLGGMVLVETIFNWPGVGQFAYESVLSVDYPSIIGVALLIACLLYTSESQGHGTDQGTASGGNLGRRRGVRQ